MSVTSVAGRVLSQIFRSSLSITKFDINAEWWRKEMTVCKSQQPFADDLLFFLMYLLLPFCTVAIKYACQTKFHFFLGTKFVSFLRCTSFKMTDYWFEFGGSKRRKIHYCHWVNWVHVTCRKEDKLSCHLPSSSNSVCELLSAVVCIVSTCTVMG